MLTPFIVVGQNFRYLAATLNLNVTSVVVESRSQYFIGAIKTIGGISTLRRNEAAFDTAKIPNRYNNRDENKLLHFSRI